MDQNLQNIIRDQIATTGKGSGIIGYSDFDKSQTPGTEFPNMNTMMADLAKGKISPAEFANLTTLGRLNYDVCLLYTSPSPRDGLLSRMPSSA